MNAQLDHGAVADGVVSAQHAIADVTALDAAPRLSARLDTQVLLKREDQQPVFSFKLRGTCNRMAQLSPAMRRLWAELKQTVEPSSIIVLAALLVQRERFAGKRVGLVSSGGNVDLDALAFRAA